MVLTKQCMLEHAVWLDFVERGFEKALLLEFVIIVIVNRRKLLCLELVNTSTNLGFNLSYLFVQEF
jgi:hypothetical protein